MKNLIGYISSHDFTLLLRDRPYMSFLLSVIFSQVAFNMMNVVLIFLVYNLTSSNFLVSVILFISLLPQVFLSFIGGIIADSKNKKYILIWGNLGRAMCILLLFFFSNVLGVIYVAALLISIVTQFYIPAETPIIPKLIPEKLLIAANSLFGLALFGSILIGYVLAGPALTALGNSFVFLLLACLFGAAGLFAHFIPKEALRETVSVPLKKHVTEQVEESIKSYLKETYRLVRNTADVGPSFILLIVSQVVIMILAIIIPGYAKDILHINVENVSLLLFAPAALGMVFSALIVGTIFKETNRNKLMNFGVILSAIVLLLLPAMSRVTSREFVVSANELLPHLIRIDTLNMVTLLAFLAGVGNAFIFIPAQTTIQEKIPENFRSKIYGLLFALIGLFSLVPIILVGGLADVIGVNSVLIIIGALILIGETAQIIILRTLNKNN